MEVQKSPIFWSDGVSLVLKPWFTVLDRVGSGFSEVMQQTAFLAQAIDSGKIMPSGVMPYPSLKIRRAKVAAE